ncbi:MAG: hypothetical protein PHU25_07020 [Deltaproteobacteria bacterium]|nr:hypothetical protein [Deltaproteobacteria bacterium]
MKKTGSLDTLKAFRLGRAVAVCAVLLAPAAAMAGEGGDTVDGDKLASVQGGMRHPLPLPVWSFGLGLYYRTDEQTANFEDASADRYVDGPYFTREISLIPKFSLAVVPDLVDIYGDLQMGILFDSDMPNTFVIESFAVGGQYTFYNDSPLVFAAGLSMRFLSQSYMDVFSMDVFHIRPYITGGPIFGLGALTIAIVPYFGIPLFFDTNGGNDPTFYRKNVPTTPGSQGGPYMVSYSGSSTFSKTHYGEPADKHDPSLPPNRRQSYFLDESPGGVDYGLPVIFNFDFGLFLVAEIFGTAWLWPDQDSWNYAGPTVGVHLGPATISATVMFALDHHDQQEFWNLSIGAGFYF